MGDGAVNISAEIMGEICQRALAAAPNECCGIIAFDGDEAVKVYPATNVDPEPEHRFSISGAHQFVIRQEIDEQGWEVGAIYHSHPRGRAYPSREDARWAGDEPMLIIAWRGDPVCLSAGGMFTVPELRAFEIVNGEVLELPLEIEQ